MTLDAKSGVVIATPDDPDGKAPEVQSGYETPVLIPLGNVHALLAAGGTSATTDGPPGQMRPAGH